jgi:hypothetical protein
MSAPYSLKAFNQDMAQLGGMIENFYTQSGGASKKKHIVKPKVKPKKVKLSKKKKGGDIPPSLKQKRKFKILNVNGSPYAFYARYTGAEPKDAAKKAGKFACGKLKMNKSCNLTFDLKETTRGSDKRIYGPYKGRFEKLDKPKVLKFPGKKQFTQYHKFVVKLSKK